MKKYTSGAFAKTTYGIYKEATDTITSFPASIIANGGNITPWTVYGNTVEGVSVGNKTNNLWNSGDVTIALHERYKSITVSYEAGIYNLSFEYISENTSSVTIVIYNGSEITQTSTANLTDGKGNIAIRTEQPITTIRLYSAQGYTPSYDYAGEYTKIMLNTGDTALPYEPYGYKLPVVIGSNTTNIYMADVLRMSSGADPVYDIMSSTGTITRNVDTDGTPLITPTTESFTAPTIATVAGSQSVSFDTTVKPSKAELTYTGWHRYVDKEYSGGGWGVNILATNKKSILGV